MLLLMIIEALVINHLNLEMLLNINGLSDICRIIMEQPMPSEVNSKQANIFQNNDMFIN